jgi:hypothetical protein
VQGWIKLWAGYRPSVSWPSVADVDTLMHHSTSDAGLITIWYTVRVVRGLAVAAGAYAWATGQHGLDCMLGDAGEGGIVVVVVGVVAAKDRPAARSGSMESP